MGWESGPTLALLAWEAQWLLYTGELERKLTRPAFSLPIFTDQVKSGVHLAARLQAPELTLTFADGTELLWRLLISHARSKLMLNARASSRKLMSLASRFLLIQNHRMYCA